MQELTELANHSTLTEEQVKPLLERMKAYDLENTNSYKLLFTKVK